MVFFFVFLTSNVLFSEEVGEGRYQLKNLNVKSYYMNQQNELTRWVDEELVKFDTVTGKTWIWVSERSEDRKELKEYWKELNENNVPITEGAR